MNTLNVLDAFDRSLGLFPSFSTTTVVNPKVDVRETNQAYIMDMDLPGLSENDVEISLKDRVLSISSMQEAKKEENKKEAQEEYLIRERRTSGFARRFTLPEDIDAEKVDASFRNGVLTITIPRRPETQPRQILIKTA